METPNRLAFTLIELLVVIAIIGILSGLIIVTMAEVTGKANIAKSQVFSNSLKNALMLNLVSEWKLDNGSGTSATDSWSGGNNGTLSGFADTTAGYGDSHNSGWMSSSNCISGTCLNFDGVNDYVNFGNGILDITGNITVEVWIKSSRLWSPSNQKYVNILAKDDADDGYALRIYERSVDLKNYLEFRLMSGGSYSGGLMYVVPNNFSYQSWTNIVGTRDGVAIRLYINGVLAATAADHAPGSNASGLYLGFSAGGLSAYTYWPGAIDNVRIYGAAVPVSGIRSRYYSGLNNLLSTGAISQSEYSSRVLDFNSGYAKR